MLGNWLPEIGGVCMNVSNCMGVKADGATSQIHMCRDPAHPGVSWQPEACDNPTASLLKSTYFSSKTADF